ncbi:TRAP transporter small permease [Desulfopila inferna]|uniref:TRAP transporter small permease n=1 Tax=Desulfopila inferna TaxID=468528 RepID=UPI0019631D2B|nr:TRAP transporter small permease [Desulfopila inferna]MBM9604490.1 TRAP transporter small permease [Desulfopila inferna]
MRKFIGIIEKITDILSGYIPALLVFLLMVMVLIEVITRYVFNAPISIAEELGGYMLVAITFLGLGYTWKERSHVSVELFTNILPEKMRKWVRFFTLTLAVIFCWPLIAGSYELLQDSIFFGARSGTWLKIPLVIPQSFLLIGSGLLLLQLIAEVIKAILPMKHSAGENS